MAAATTPPSTAAGSRTRMTELGRRPWRPQDGRREPAEAAGAGRCSWRGPVIFRRNGDRNGAVAPYWTGNPGRGQHATCSLLPRCRSGAFYEVVEYTQTVVCRCGRSLIRLPVQVAGTAEGQGAWVPTSPAQTVWKRWLSYARHERFAYRALVIGALIEAAASEIVARQRG
jgi:hypothetical protein